MGGPGRQLTRLILALAAGAVIAGAAPSRLLSQSLGQVISDILIIDRERLLSETAFARRLQAEIEAERRVLASEARAIEAELAAEEQALTEKRAELSPEDFRPLAAAFDEKVLRIRAESAANAQAFQTQSDEKWLGYLNRILPVLDRLMRDREAAVLLDQRVVFMSIEGVDATDEAIARIDAALGDGAPEGPAPPPQE